MTRRAPISRRARTLRRIPPARPVRRAARSPVRIPISQEPHHHLKNCDGYTLRETDDAKRAQRLSACLTDGVMAYAPLVRRLVALRTFRKARRSTPMYERLDADVKAVQALGQGKAPLYRYPRYRLASAVLRPRDPAHRDVLLAWPRAQLPIHRWQRRVTQKIARHYTHLQAMSRGRLALVFPVPRDATTDEVREVGHDLTTAVLAMTVVLKRGASAAATLRRRRRRHPQSTRKKGGHPLPGRVDTNSPAFRQHIERLYAQSLLGGGISCEMRPTFSPMPATLSKLVKASYVNLPHDGVMMRPYHCVLDRVLRTPDATSAPHLRVCAPHVKSAFQDHLKRNSLMWKRERDSNVQARLMHRMQEIRQSQKGTTTRASPHARKWNILEKSQANLAHTLAYAVLQCHREYNLIVLPLNVSSSSCHDHANVLLIDLRPRARAAHQGRACLTWFEPNGHTFAQRTTIRCPKGSDTTATMLAQEVHHANRLLVKLDLASHQIDPQIDLASGQGIQTALGSQETRVQALTGQRQQCLQGFGVCGAITFWMLSMWIKKWHHKYPLFRDFQAAFERRLYHADPKVAMAKREEYKLRLRSFIAHVARSHVSPASSSQQSQFQRTVCEKVCDDVESYFLTCPHLRRLGALALASTPFKCVTNITYTFSPSSSVSGLNVRVPIRLRIASDNKQVTLSFRSHQLQRTYAYAPDRTAHGGGSSPWMRVQNE